MRAAVLKSVTPPTAALQRGHRCPNSHNCSDPASSGFFSTAMSQLHMTHEQPQPQHRHNHHHHHQDSFEDHTSGWPTTGAYDPEHQSPVQDYNSFSNYAPLPMEPLCTQAMHLPPPQPRTAHPLPPLVMPPPQWPSMLTSSNGYWRRRENGSPVSATPASATSTHSGRTPSTPRKLLTDADRRRMCQYHEDHPTVKQTEIGGELLQSVNDKTTTVAQNG